MKTSTIVTVAGAVVLVLVLSKTAAGQTLLGGKKPLTSPTRIGPYPQGRVPAGRGGSTADTVFSGINAASNLLKSISSLFTDPKKSSGSPSGGSAGGFGTGQPSGNTGGQGGRVSPTGRNTQGGNFGDYFTNGQLYNADGQALDDNGRIIPGQFDNSGTGPAGAGINADLTLASNPLEWTNPNDPTTFGVVLPLNNPTGGFAIPEQPEGGSGAYIQSLVEAGNQASWLTGPGGTLQGPPDLGAQVDPSQLPGATTMPLPPIIDFTGPSGGSYEVVDDGSNGLPPADSTVADRTDPGFPADTSLTSGQATDNTFPGGWGSPEDTLPPPAEDWTTLLGNQDAYPGGDYSMYESGDYYISY